MGLWNPGPRGNPYAVMQPSRALTRAARAAGITGGRAEIYAWAKESGWLDGEKAAQ